MMIYDIYFNLKWRIIDKAPRYNPMTKRCNLCNKEKFYIMYKPHMATLNKRSEIYTACRHRHMELLAKSWTISDMKLYLSFTIWYCSSLLFLVFVFVCYHWGLSFTLMKLSVWSKCKMFMLWRIIVIFVYFNSVISLVQYI